MKENDKVTQLPKRTLSASNYATPITNQANVATRLGETFGKKAHDLVWESELAEWEDKAREFVNLTYGNHYGTRWVSDDGDDHSARANHPAGRGLRDSLEAQSITRVYPPTPRYLTDPVTTLDEGSTQHQGPAPLAGHLRLDGGTV